MKKLLFLLLFVVGCTGPAKVDEIVYVEMLGKNAISLGSNGVYTIIQYVDKNDVIQQISVLNSQIKPKKDDIVKKAPRPNGFGVTLQFYSEGKSLNCGIWLPVDLSGISKSKLIEKCPPYIFRNERLYKFQSLVQQDHDPGNVAIDYTPVDGEVTINDLFEE